jgi:hypothetical protein
MFQYLPAKNNKQKKEQKESYLEYIHTSIERSTIMFNAFPAKLEVMMQDNIEDMRKDFKRIVKRIKDKYS